MTDTINIPADAAAHSPLAVRFLKWQCRVRQMAMREDQGRPGDAVMPQVFLPGQTEPTGQIVTVLNKNPTSSMVPEMQHMARKTHDPAQVRSLAIQFLSATYFQQSRSFSDVLTAVFPPQSPGARKICAANSCTLEFRAYAKHFSLVCQVRALSGNSPLFDATMAHNRLFNLSLPGDSVVLAFEPDWNRSSSSQETR